MPEEDAGALCGRHHARNTERKGHRWGTTQGPVGFHGGKTKVKRPRVRGKNKKEIPLPGWNAAQEEDWLGKWAMKRMLINVSTRKFSRAVRLPEGDIPVEKGDGTSKSAASRHFVALSAAKMKEWMSGDLSKPDLPLIQIDGLHIKDGLVMIAAVGIDADGHRHPLAVIEGATENTASVQALLDDLVGAALIPGSAACSFLTAQRRSKRRFATRLASIRRSSVVRCTNRAILLIGCQRVFMGRPKKRCGKPFEMDDTDKGEKLLRNLARRPEKEAPGVSGSIPEGIDDILTVTRPGLPEELRRSLACTNIIENMMGTIRRVSRNVKRRRNAKMALRWTAAGMMEAKKGFRRIRACKQLPQLQAALPAHQKRHQENTDLDRQAKAA